MSVIVLIVSTVDQTCHFLCVTLQPESPKSVSTSPNPTFKGRPIVGSEAGLSGSYFLNAITAKEDDRPEWVYKPRSQEAEKSGEVLKSGATKGTSCIKEVAAYVVDHMGFAGVPETTAITANVQLEASTFTDFGSLQKYIESEGSCEEYGSSLFDVEHVHQIGLLDLRIGNCDRHEGNLLVVRENGKLQLVPIDHGYCLPTWRNLNDLYFCWSSWRQASLPFSERSKQYILSLDPLLDVPRLLSIGVGHDNVITYVLCSLFVQRCVLAGLNLRQIAELMQRDFNEKASQPSPFESLVYDAAHRTGFNGMSLQYLSDWRLPIVANFFQHFLYTALDLLQDFKSVK